jgi:aldose sugar dehydrogenase
VIFNRLMLAGVSGLFFLTLCAEGEPVAGPNRTAPALYAQLCANCHGDDLRGAKVASLLDRQWKHGDDDASLLRVMRDGIATSGMPAFGETLSQAELRALVVFIRETALRTKEPTPLRAEPLPAGVQTSEEHGWRAELVVEGFDVPWSLAFLPDGRMLVTDRVGTLHIVEGGRIGPKPIEGVPPVWVRDEAGLMCVVPHPDYAKNGWIYLSLSDPGDDDTAMTRVVRGRIRDGRWTDQEDIFHAPREAYTNNGTNFGSRLVFNGDYLFFTVGERGAVGQAQDLTKPNGKVHRVFHDGTIPPDNPFIGTPGAVGSIWSYGHRNPQGLALDPVGHGIWETEHGPRGGDELNHIKRGHNYGWPLITHGMNYNGTPVSPHTEREGLDQPVVYWTPSIAVSPIHFYTGDRFPKWKNNLFVGSLAQQKLLRMTVDGDRVTHQELVFKGLGRIRDVKTGPDGFLYIVFEIPGPYPGRIIRLVPADDAI